MANERLTAAPSRRAARDETNARLTRDAAAARAPQVRQFKPERDMVRGTSIKQVAIAQAIDGDRLDLQRIAERPFDAMLEVEINGGSPLLWYAHRDTSGNQSIAIPENGAEVRVLSWTHPGIQAGLSGVLGTTTSIKRAGYTIKSVKPIARARFDHVFPTVSGIYDPGGRVGEPVLATAASKGLKAVKLDMTPEQVQAFLNRMRGVMIVTGAPGTGKTTVAFQRIRFLFDQQNLRDPSELKVPYEPELTRVFLASRNLIAYSRALLRDELRVPADVVTHVGDFLRQYLDRVWQPKLDARPSTKKTTPEEFRAREAFLNLGEVKDLHEMWQTLEKQVRSRLVLAADSDWKRHLTRAGGDAARNANDLVGALAKFSPRASVDLQDSLCRMDAVWRLVRRPYEGCRLALSEGKREEFDDRFAKWLLHSYDPLDVLASHFSLHRDVAAHRIAAGTGALTDPIRVVDSAIDGWRKRTYGVAEVGWISWILRFALPEQSEPEDGFRAVPRAIARPNHKTERRWTHVMIDEAQDLSVQEASLLASMVHPNGALTVSADFQQVVSPVHGMTNGEALKCGLAIRDQALYTQYPFSRNLRQSREIGRFLASFYEKAFGEFPQFEAGPTETKFMPELYTGSDSRFAGLIAQLVNVLRARDDRGSAAILFIDEADDRMRRLRAALHTAGVHPSPVDEVWSERQLIMTTVERAKGLEYTTCVVIGLDDLERSSLNFWKNRAYVALSRPTTRLIMLCEQYPPILQHVRKDLFDHRALA